MKKIFAFLMMAVMVAALGSCSKEDEPSDYEPTYDGVNVYLNAIETLYDGEAMPAFTPSPVTSGTYLAQAPSAETARSFIARLIENEKWDGKNVTISLGEHGELGSLKIKGTTTAMLDEGIYNEIVIDITGYTPYTLQIITTEKAENLENGKGKDIVVLS